MQEPTREYKLIAILKNGAVIFSDVRESDLAIYCQNALTGQLSTVVQSFKVVGKDKIMVSALSSENGKNISILISYKNKHKNISSTANVRESDGKLYRFGWSEGKIIGSINKKKLYGAQIYLPYDSLGNGGVFHSDSDVRVGSSVFDVDSGKVKRIDLGGNLSFQDIKLHSWLPDGFFCLAMYKRKSASFFNVGLGASYLKLYDSKQEFVKPIMEIELDRCVHAVALSRNKQFLAIHKSTLTNCDSHGTFDENDGIGHVEIWSVLSNKKIAEVELLNEHPHHYRGRGENITCGALSMAVSNSGSLAVVYRYEGVEWLRTYSAHNKKIHTLNMQKEGMEEWSYNGSRKVLVSPRYRAGYFTEDENGFLFPSSGRSWHFCKKDPMSGEWFVADRCRIDQIKLSQNPQLLGTQTIQNIRDAAQLPPLFLPQNSTRNVPSAPVMGTQTVDNMARHLVSPSAPPEETESKGVLGLFKEITDTLEGMNANLDKVIVREQARLAKLRNMNWEKEMVAQLEACQNDNLDIPPIPEIHCNELQFRKKLGRGGQGVVELCEWRSDVVAVKTVLCEYETEISQNIRQLKKEAFTMGCLNHSNIVNVLGYTLKRDGSFSLFLQYYPNGALSDYLYSPKKWNNSFTWRLRCAKEISDGLMYLHKYNLLHLDLKPENIFLDKEWHAVIGDFGISRALGNNRTHMTLPHVQGTVAFIAPELFGSPQEMDMESRYRPSCDIFSFGMLLWCLMAQKRPFAGMNGLQIMQAVLNEGRREIIPEKLSSGMRQLIEKCWSPNFFERPDINYVNAKLIRGYDKRMSTKDQPVVFGAVLKK